MSDDLNSLWSLMNVANAHYWFLGVDTASEVTESFKDVDSSKDGESFEMNVKVVQVTLESGLGHRTVPLLLAESSFTGTAQNWSSLLSVSADMTLEVNYFNETHAVWEPLLERVDNGRRRWNLKLEVSTIAFPFPLLYTHEFIFPPSKKICCSLFCWWFICCFICVSVYRWRITLFEIKVQFLGMISLCCQTLAQLSPYAPKTPWTLQCPSAASVSSTTWLR